MKIIDAYLRFYEARKIYRANPCDRDSALQPVGRALTHFGSHCPCCSGTRVLAAVALSVMFPTAMSYLAAGAFFVALVYELYKPPSR